MGDFNCSMISRRFEKRDGVIIERFTIAFTANVRFAFIFS